MTIPNTGAAPEASTLASGVVLMALAMLSIPLADGIGKLLSADYSPLFVSWARYVVAAAIILPIGVARFGRQVFPAEQRISHVLRTAFLVGAMSLYFVAVAEIHMATAISIFFIGPVIAVVLSIFLLGERMTGRKWISLGAGLAGSLVIWQPGGASFEPGMLYALGAGVLFAFYMIATRRAARSSDPVKTLVFQCCVGALFLLPQAIVTWDIPQEDHLPLFLGLGAVSVISHIMSIYAFKLAEASLLSPIVYLELVGSALIGYLLFSEIPGMNTVAGAAMIVAAGLIRLPRSSKRA